MRVLEIGVRWIGRIDPKEEKRRKSKKGREIGRKTPFSGEFFFSLKKNHKGGFPYGHYTTATPLWVAGNR
jgi:hypothetical protein